MSDGSYNPLGDYNQVGDLSAWTDYGNAHAYPHYSPLTNDGEGSGGSAFQELNYDANLAASGRPVAITEYGWLSNQPGSFGDVSLNTQATYAVEGILDGWLLHDAYYFYYALTDDGSGNFGLYYNNPLNPKPAATAIRVLYQLLGDSGANATTFTPGSLDYSISNMPSGNPGGQQLLFQKSDGTFWLVLWNEEQLNSDDYGNDYSIGNVDITLHLGSVPQSIQVYDVLSQNTTPVATPTLDANNNTTISLPAHPILVEIVHQ